MITVTDSAVKQLQILIAEHSAGEKKGLRIFVEAGGCCGMQYGMAIDHHKDGDEIIERNNIQVFVDAFSAEKLHGATIDFVAAPAGGGFRIKNPNASNTCGCGASHDADRSHRHGH